jgi:undecaprenyl diphosphate synthase
MTRSTPIEPLAPRSAWPKHIAIIMDGNGRWAEEQGKSRILGHRQGAESVRSIVEHARRLKLEALTLYSFSSENWKRPKPEVDALMTLCAEHLVQERPTLLKNNIRLRRIGRDENMPDHVLEEIARTEEATAHCTGMTLVLAINYGSRAEITDACRSLCEDARDGTLDPGSITEEDLASRLYTAGLPDPDLLIRTAGERRLSNYLLWQISYAEIHISDVNWPDFDEERLNEAIEDFANRTRRFGGVPPHSPQA